MKISFLFFLLSLCTISNVYSSKESQLNESNIRTQNHFVVFNNMYFNAFVNKNQNNVDMQLVFLLHKKANSIICNKLMFDDSEKKKIRSNYLILNILNISFEFDSLKSEFNYTGKVSLSFSNHQVLLMPIYSKILVKDQKLTFFQKSE